MKISKDKLSLLQLWWEETYPNAGVENVYNVSDKLFTNKDLYKFEQWVIAYIISKQLSNENMGKD